MSNSSLVDYTRISPNKTSPRNHAIDTITIHCVVGQCTAESLGAVFAPASRKGSSNYGVDKDGRIGMYVEEKDRSWCSSSSANDNRAITIEVASDTKAPYAVTDKAYKGLINLLVDICTRNNIKELKWKGDKSLVGKVSQQNMTVHRWFAATECPGEYLYERMGKIASDVNTRLKYLETPKKDLYHVQLGVFRNKAYAEALYRKAKTAGFVPYIVQSGANYKVFAGSNENLSKLDTLVANLKAKGFDTCITKNGGDPVAVSNKKTVDQIAKEVIRGLWGVGSDRKNRLTKAGYDYTAVQKRVNELLSKE